MGKQDHPSATARILRQPSAQERAAGRTLFIEPPLSENIIEKAINWMFWAMTAGISIVVVMLIMTVIFILT